MSAKWGWVLHLGILGMLVLTGCRTPQPDLKPKKEPEVFNPPSDNLNNNYPKQAFNTDDPSKRLGLDPGGLTPARGAGPGSMSPGGSGSFGGPGH
jgi:hypothetical protein